MFCILCDESITDTPKFIAKPDGGYREHPSLSPKLQLRVGTAHSMCAEKDRYASRTSSAILMLSDARIEELTAELS